MEDMRKRIAMLMDSRQWRDRYFKMVKEALQDPEVQAFLKQHTGELADDAIERGTAKIYEFVSERNKIARGELPLAPGYKPTLVAANGLIDVAYEPTDAKIAADEEAKQASLVTSVNMPKGHSWGKQPITIRLMSGWMLCWRLINSFSPLLPILRLFIKDYI